MARVAEGTDIFADEHDARIHGPQVPQSMPESHPAIHVGEAEAPAGNRHPQEGPGHVTWYPQHPGQDPVHCPLGAAQARRAQWHGLVDIVQGRDDVCEDNTEDEHVGRAQVVERALVLRQAGFRLGNLRGRVFTHH